MDVYMVGFAKEGKMEWMKCFTDEDVADDLFRETCSDSANESVLFTTFKLENTCLQKQLSDVSKLSEQNKALRDLIRVLI